MVLASPAVSTIFANIVEIFIALVSLSFPVIIAVNPYVGSVCAPSVRLAHANHVDILMMARNAGNLIVPNVF